MARKLTAALALALIFMFVPSASPVHADDNWRFGFGANRDAINYNWTVLGASWFHNWRVQAPYHLDGMDFYPMVGAYGDLMGNETETSIRNAINQRPSNYPDGTTWIISNELEYDIFTTKNGVPLNPPRAITPAEYAEKYKKYRDIIKSINPTYKTAIGFINAIAETGRPYVLTDFTSAIDTLYGHPADLPIDCYNLHTYAFGRSIDFEITFQTTVNRYREAMASISEREKPLIITELGVLEGVYVTDIPESYVLDFQTRAFDWLRSATSATTGMPSDGNHLVQRWAWFALTSWHPSDDYKWHRTALFDIDTTAITNLGQAYSDYVQGMGSEMVSIPLQAGWNLISTPVLLGSYDVPGMFASIDGSYDLVYAWDSAHSAWKLYDVNGPPGGNTLSTLSNTQGFWIHATEATTLVLSGEPQSGTSISLSTGWNLIAYPLTDAKSVTQALSSISGKYTSVYEYDPCSSGDPWRKYLPSAPSYVNTLTQMRPGFGYWIKATHNCTLTL